MNGSKKIGMLVFLTLAVWTLASFGEELAPKPEDLPKGTRSLVFSEEGTPTQTFAVSLEVELLTDNPALPGTMSWVPVPNNRVFSSGEKVRFTFTPTQDAYAYLICKHSDGTSTMLWSSLQLGTDCFVPAGRKITIPSTGNPNAGWVFTDPPGIEQLVLVLSHTRIAELDALIATIQGRGSSPEMTANEYKQVEKTVGEINTRNLMHVPGEGPQAPPIVYTPAPEEPLKVRIDLTHGVPVPVAVPVPVPVPVP